ncbi:regulator of chromosome condensation 1/beta-lactamase-inhibitor protein II [Sordaria brevicollis]|uniref:Regulator of chromosome condensation 1/beta-lactamase-inhibitor protein II n=1 Tax=Sordaria brevicollis TaxID=83679 RepID=A0AAE0UCN9_SORBR|nr:regulator of chromosome condensation 1/beta-lactamase-inhibitor protein II [Sordaria brevicollis]
MLLLFALGSNGSGQLGIGHKEDVSVPKDAHFEEELPATASITKIAAGGNHTIVLTTTGDIHWSGDPNTGACGKFTQTQVSQPPRFYPVDLSSLSSHEDLFRVGLVAATWESSIFTRLDAQGRNTRIYSCGTGQKGELGLGNFIFRTATPSLIPDFPPPDTEIVDIAACMGHVVAVLSNGDVWGWGNGRKGQIGAPEDIIYSPRKLEGINFKVVKAVCGKEFTCLLGSPESGNIVVLGSDKWGIKAETPSQVVGWREVGASWGNLFILKADGSVLSWGRNDHGQLAPASLTQTKHIAVGSEHTLALSEEGDVTAWGWGEHGNCGPLSNSDVTKGQQNVIASSKFIPPGAKITAIGAGCATSWVAIQMPSA